MRARIFNELVLTTVAACFIAAAWTAALTTGGRWAMTGIVIWMWAFIRAMVVLP